MGQAGLTFNVANEIFSTTIDIIGDMIGQYAELDAAITEFVKVSDLSGKALDEYVNKLGQIGTTVARTASEMVEGATQFRKNGYNDKDSAQLAQIAAMYQNVSDTTISAGESASFIISQMKAFNIETSDAVSIIDKVNEVANNFSVGTNDLSNALEVAGAGLSTYNNDINQTIALVTAGSEIMTGRSLQVARGLNTIAARLVNNQDLLAQYGISLNNADGSMRSTFEILEDLSEAWKKMGDEERVTVGNAIAGINQYKVLAAVMQNFDSAIDANQTALKAQGSAMQENERFMESYEAKINGLKAAWQNLSTAVIDGDFLKGTISGLSNLIEKLSESKVAVMAIQTLLGTGAIWSGKKLLDISNVVDVLKSEFKVFFSEFKTIASALPQAFSVFMSIFKSGGGLIEAIKGAGFVFEYFGAELSLTLPIIAIATAAIIGLGMAFKSLKQAQYEKSFENQNIILQEMQQAYEDMVKEKEALEAKGDNLNDAERSRLDYLEKQLEILEAQSDVAGSLAEQQEKTWDAWEKEFYGKTIEQGKSFASDFGGGQITPNVVSYARDFEQLISVMQDGSKTIGQQTSDWGDYLATYKDVYEQTIRYREAGRTLTPLMQNLVTMYEIATDTYKDMANSTGQATSGIETLTNAYSPLSEQVKTATLALERFNEVASVDYEAPIKGYQSAYSQFLEDFEAGKMGAGSIRAAVDLFIPRDKQTTLMEDANYLATTFADGFGQTLFAEGDPVLAFGDLLISSLDTSGKLTAEIDGQMKNLVTTLDDGTYSISSYKDLAEYFGTTPELIEAMFYGLQEYNAQLILTEEDWNNLAADIQSLESQDPASVFQKISEAIGSTDPEKIAEAANKLQELGAIDFESTTDGVRDTLDGLQEVSDAKEDVGEEVSLSIYDNSPEVLDNLHTIADELASLTSKPYTITIQTSGSGISFGKSGGISGKVGDMLGKIIGENAKGTDNFKGGLSLVNDGSPVNGSSKELIIDNGRAFIANGEPALVNLSKGAQIYTAKETQDILGGVPAFATGKISSAVGKVQSALSVFIPTSATQKGTSTGKGGSGDISGSTSGNDIDSGLPTLSKEEFDKLLKEKKHMLAMDEITEKEYYDWLADANDKYLKDREEYLDEYWRHQEEIYNYEKQALKDEITLEEKLNELAKAKTKRVLVYKDGMFQYVSNTEAIAKAQREVSAYGGGTTLLDNYGVVGGLGGMNGVNVGGSGETNITNINVEEVTLEKADNVEELFEGLSNLAIQQTTSRG